MNTMGLFRNAPNSTTFKAGETIFKEGDAGDNMYVIQSGAVEIMLHGRLLETASEGGIFGEMALIDQQPRSGTVIAKTDCKVVPINQKQFLYLLGETPYFAIQVMHVMAERLRRQHLGEG
ncbi:MAG TPA: cyclic nucleotide-binding domain-containing protein [Phototrophicaceae bacterium]|nr:cyclic nucleotide-binding domain-containing protein [Phototrophicaceae bacterium]